ncbi:unnamed protein product [Ilex paraguariensis]
MKVLSTIRMDGTFNQLAPLHRLKGRRELYSFDLKSAQVEEGLLPVDLSGSLLASLFGDSLAMYLSGAWCFLMTMVGFRSPDRLPSRLKARVYRFTRGPLFPALGYYSSWPVFTLTHHALVWLAAYEVYPGQRFEDYAILGDDIVIADKKVALEYQRIMEEAQGVISKEKSLVSSKGACEFAKRFIITTGQIGQIVVLFPCRVLKYVLFMGYRVFSKVRVGVNCSFFDSLSPRWKRHWLTLYSGSGICPLPFKLWLAFPERGILTCYEEGAVRAFILERVAPRDLDEESFSQLRLFWINDEEMMLERLLQSYLKLHLEYLHWYAKVILDFSISLEDLMKPPIAPRRIVRVSDESTLKRYGLAFKAWDFVRNLKPILALDAGPTRGFILL